MEYGFVEIPIESLSEDASRGLIESFVLREGTDYGSYEVSLEQKILQVLKQIKAGEIKIVFSAETESIDILTLREFKLRLQKLEESKNTQGHGD